MFLDFEVYCGKISALIIGQLAQGLARFLHTEEVTGSNPVLPIVKCNKLDLDDIETRPQSGFFAIITA